LAQAANELRILVTAEPTSRLDIRFAEIQPCLQASEECGLNPRECLFRDTAEKDIK